MHNHKGKLCTEDKSHMAKACVSIEACTQITITSWPLCIIPKRSTKVSSKNNFMLMKKPRSQDTLFYCSHRIRSPPFLLGWLAIKLRVHCLSPQWWDHKCALMPSFQSVGDFNSVFMVTQQVFLPTGLLLQLLFWSTIICISVGCPNSNQISDHKVDSVLILFSFLKFCAKSECS